MSADATGDSTAGTATLMARLKVRTGRVDDHRRWQVRGDDAAREFQAFEGAEVAPPDDGEGSECIAPFFSSDIRHPTTLLFMNLVNKSLGFAPVPGSVRERLAQMGAAAAVLLEHAIFLAIFGVFTPDH